MLPFGKVGGAAESRNALFVKLKEGLSFNFTVVTCDPPARLKTLPRAHPAGAAVSPTKVATTSTPRALRYIGCPPQAGLRCASPAFHLTSDHAPSARSEPPNLLIRPQHGISQPQRFDAARVG